MPRPVHFEIHASDPARAEAFYKDVFGWEFAKWDGPVNYWLVRTGRDTPGIDGGMVERKGDPPAEGAAVNGYVCTIGVSSLDTYLTRAIEHGATVALPKMATPGVGWLAYIKDTEGNILGMLEPDPNAS
jgi:predicted enzyme related to lactoylglutathione lyase